MTDRFRHYLTSVLALGLGAALGRAGWQDRGNASAGDAAVLPADHVPAATSNFDSSRNSRAAEPRHTQMSPESAALSAAWNSLKSGRHSPVLRGELQEAIIEKWALIDPESAIAAVLADVPHLVDADLLLIECARALGEDAGRVLQMLEREPFGVDTGRFRRVWLSLHASREPVETIGLVDQLSPLDRRLVVEELAQNLFEAREEDFGHDPVWNRLLELHGGPAWENDAWAIAKWMADNALSKKGIQHRKELLEATHPACLDLRATVVAYHWVSSDVTEAYVKQTLPVLPSEIRDAVLEKWKLHRKSEP